MIVTFLSFVVVIGAPFLHCRYPNHPLIFVADTLFGIALGVLIEKTRNNWRYLKLATRLLLMRIQGRPLRISFAALVRVCRGNNYLLVKSSRTNKWQPVGGVIRFYDNRLRTLLEMKDDFAMKSQEPPELRRSFAPERVFNAFRLLRWFVTRKGREVSPHREFYEELVNDGIVPAAIFAQPEFEFVGGEYAITFSVHHQCWELKYFEIFEFIPNHDQEKILDGLLGARNSESPYVFLTQAEIEAEGHCSNGAQYPVGDQTKFIL